MLKFWELLQSSVIVQGIVTLLFSVAIVALLIMQKTIPSELWASFGLILGYWFGTKQNYQITKTIEAINKTTEATKSEVK